MADPSRLHAQAVSAFQHRDWPKLKEFATHLLSRDPNDAGVHYFAGVASLELRQIAQAVQHLQRAVQLDATRTDFLVQFARALTVARLPREALEAADKAYRLAGGNPLAFSIIGNVYAQNQAHERAIAAFREAVALAPSRAAYRFNLGVALIAVGDVEAAEGEIEACLSLESTFWRAHLTLANLRRQSPSSNHLERLESLLPQATGNALARTCLHMALAKEYEDLTEYPLAFVHLQLGKAAGREGLDYSIQHDEELFAALTRAFAQQLPPPKGEPSTEPLFVFGMPRSGTTLVERILSNHPDVVSCGELQNFGLALQRAWRGRLPLESDPDIAAHTLHIDWQQVGSGYLSSTRPISGSTPHFIDKLPHNFLYAGFIACALPNAKMICLRRDPMDTCLGNFRQLFAEKLPYYNYSFDLLDTGRYYALFDRLMVHWKTVFPGRILELSYEELVEAPEKTARTLLQHCGLSWNDACLRIEENPTPVATASALQVREAIHRSTVGRWRNYEDQLADLRHLLLDLGVKLES